MQMFWNKCKLTAVTKPIITAAKEGIISGTLQ
jgi:hypothetical protein